MAEPFLLESSRADPKTSRWSIFAAEPVRTFALKDDVVRQTGPVSRERTERVVPLWIRPTQPNRKSVLDLLREWSSAFLGAEPLPLAVKIPGPFAGGAIGWLGYDLGRSLERLPNRLPDAEDWGDMRLGLYDTFAVFDHKHGTCSLVARNFEGVSVSPPAERIDKWGELIASADLSRSPQWHGLPVSPCLSRADYLRRVERVLEYIRAGDIFQANMTQRFEAHGEGDPLALFARLARISPAPFAAFARWEDKALVCSSPEWFYRILGDHVVTRPIKGTRPRGATEAEDAAERADLLASAKDRAELTMIVDLERNDLGRVCRFGSVKVNSAMVLETYAQVHHLVAEIEGRLRPDKDAVDLLAAMFPGGSITGAPKIRAMEIIEELETHRRGIYTGAVGYIGADGRSAWNIPIRTIVKAGTTWSYNVGGGIVADSDPAKEYEETLTKGQGMKHALETPGP